MRPHPSHQRSVATLARQAIMTFTQANGLVVDPVCGTGDIVVEAVKADRMAIGVEHEQYWVDVARTRIDHATAGGLGGFGAVLRGTVDQLVTVLQTDSDTRVELILTAPQTGTVTLPDSRDTASDFDSFVDGTIAAIDRCTPLLVQNGLCGVICWPVPRLDVPLMVEKGFATAGYALVERRTTTSTSCSLVLFKAPEFHGVVPLSGNRDDIGSQS